jgi:hypothetical protein
MPRQRQGSDLRGKVHSACSRPGRLHNLLPPVTVFAANRELARQLGSRADRLLALG